MKADDRKVLRLISRRFWGTLFTLIIAFAVIVQLGREALPLLNDYKPRLEQFLSSQWDLEVSIESISASWKGLRPSIELQTVVVQDADGDHILSFAQLKSELGIIESIEKGKLFWRELTFEGFTLNAYEDENGSWAVADFMTRNRERPESSNAEIDDPFDLFLIGRRVLVANANIHLDFYNGATSVIRIPKISLDNDNEFLRVAAEASFDDASREFNFILEGIGNPKKAETFSARGYLSLTNFPITEVFGVLKNTFKLPEDQFVVSESGLNLELWFEGNTHNTFSFQSQFLVDDLSILTEQLDISARYNAGHLHGEWQSDTGWAFHINDLESIFNNATIENLNLSLLQTKGQKAKVLAENVPVTPLSNALVSSGLLGDAENRKAPAYIVHNLKPRGEVERLELQLTDAESGFFHANAVLRNAAVDAVFGVPGIDQLDGDVTFNAFSGRAGGASTSGLRLDFPGVYSQPLVFDSAEADIRWDIDLKNKTTYLSSNVIKLTSNHVEARGALRLELPFSLKVGEPKMLLDIGIARAPVIGLKPYIPKVIDPNLYTWLDDAVLDGEALGAQFIFNGSVAIAPEVPPDIQLYANVSNAVLAFSPDWPEMTALNGTVLLDDSHLDVQIESGNLLGNQIERARVNLVPIASSLDFALDISATASGKSADAIELLQQSPIKEVLQDNLDTWIFDGELAAALSLYIPLIEDQSLARQLVDVDLIDSGFRINDANFNVDNITGQLSFDNLSGFRSENLSGEIWGEPFNFSVSTRKVSEEIFDTEILFDGGAHLSDVTLWSGLPLLKFIEGRAEAEGKVIISGDVENRWPVEIQIDSNLLGTTFNVPAPFSKAVDEALPFAARIKLGDDEALYRFVLDELHEFYSQESLRSNNASLLRLNGLLTQDDYLNLTPGFLSVVGSLDGLNLKEWALVGEQLETFTHELEQQQNALIEQNVISESDLPEPSEEQILIDIDLKNLDLDFFTVERLNAKGSLVGETWNIDVKGPTLEGTVYLKGKEAPVYSFEKIVIDSAMLAQISETEHTDNASNASVESEEAVPGLRVADLDPFVFSVNRIVLEDTELGSLSLALKVEDGRAVFENIFADILGVRVVDEQGATVVWRENDGQHETQVNANLEFGNIGDILDTFELDRALTNESGRASINLAWDAPLNEPDVETVRGELDLRLTKGTFVRGEGSDETEALRLLALFNFDTIVRRLRLDFSDLASEGFAYDSVKSTMQFNEGMLSFKNPLVVKSSSSRLRMVGDIDLLNETLDTELVVTLPVTGNLAAVVGLLGGLPAAVGVYIVGKIFKRQTDKLSSISYLVKGNWADPKIKVNKLFNNKTAKQN